MRDEDPYIHLPVDAGMGTARDPQRTCVSCAGRQFRIMSDGPQRAWLKCLECGERQPPQTADGAPATRADTVS